MNEPILTRSPQGFPADPQFEAVRLLHGDYRLDGIRKQPGSNPESTTIDLPPSFLGEFRKSAIPDRLTLENIQWIEGNEAIETLAETAIAKVQRVTSYLTKPARDILKRYEFAAAGGWIAYGTTIDGEPGTVPYFKPKRPRVDFEKRKPIKYETPQGLEASPILPYVDPETAQLIYDRHKIQPKEGETFWQAMVRCGIPVAITEGLKKALALLAHGIPAIAIRGITQWHRKGENLPHPTIAQFIAPGRKVLIVFDRDSKPSTCRDVRMQILKLGKALEAMGAQVSVPVWEGETYGKGIDDCLHGLGSGAQAWLDAVIDDALDLAIYRSTGGVAAAMNVIAQLNRLSYAVERATEGDYLPQLPELVLGAIHVVLAGMNAGKTTRIGLDWGMQARSRGWLILVLSPLNSLGQQTAQNWGLPHVHDFGTDPNSQAALWSQVNHSGGVVMCPDSLHRIPAWFWQQPILLVLDEANQVIHHLCEGNTLGSRWADILERFTGAARHAIQTGAIVLSEDGIPDRAVDFIKTLSQSETVRVFRHEKQGTPWDCTLYRGQASGYRSQFLAAAKAGQRLLYVTSSQSEARRMERALSKLAQGLKVVRIDSETNQGGRFTGFFEDPDRWLELETPDILILSPSAKSGVSIQGGVTAEHAYFSAVWGYFPSLATDTHSQLLGRYRPSVPRRVFCPDWILSSGEESLSNPRAIRRRLSLNTRGLAKVYGLEALLEGDVSELQASIEGAVGSYLSLCKAVTGSQKSIAHLALSQRLRLSGHQVSTIELGKDADIVATWKVIQDELWLEDGEALAAAIVQPHHTIDWAYRKLDGLDTSREDRLRAEKVLLREQFPGVNFDDVATCYEAIYRDRGAMKRGVMLQARAENLQGSQELDRPAVEAILKGKVRPWHKLPSGYIRSALIAQSGVLELLDGRVYTGADPRCQRVKAWCLRFSNEIRYWLGLEVKDSQTAIAICHKLLRKLGIERDRSDRPGAILTVGRKGKRGANTEHFRVDLSFDPIRAQMLEAARRKVSEAVTSIPNMEIRDLENQCNAPCQPPIDPPKPSNLEPSEGAWEVEGIDFESGYSWKFEIEGNEAA